MPNGMAPRKLNIHSSAIMRKALLKPLMAYKCKGWQMAKYRSTENATIVNTETYVDLQKGEYSESVNGKRDKLLIWWNNIFC